MNRNKKNRRNMNKRRIIAGVTTATALSAALAVTVIAAPSDMGKTFDQNGQPQFGQEIQMPENIEQMNEIGFDQTKQAPEAFGQMEGTEMPQGEFAPQAGGAEMPQGEFAPQMENSQRPGGPGKGGAGPAMMGFDQFAEQGVISQDTLEAIKAYMEEHAPEGLPEINGERPEGMPEFNGEKPEGMPEFNGERPEGMPEFNGEKPEDAPDLLADLLAEGIITQDEYDALSEAMPQPGPAPFGGFGGPAPEESQENNA